MSSILELKNLSFVYGQGTPFEKCAVDNVNLSIEKGEFVGIIGHTGSGKSTLVQMLNGLMIPDSGQVFVNGVCVVEPKKASKKRSKAEKKNTAGQIVVLIVGIIAYIATYMIQTKLAREGNNSLNGIKCFVSFNSYS